MSYKSNPTVSAGGARTIRAPSPVISETAVAGKCSTEELALPKSVESGKSRPQEDPGNTPASLTRVDEGRVCGFDSGE